MGLFAKPIYKEVELGVFFLTEHAVESQWCRNEMFDCLDEKPEQIYPIYIENTKLRYGLRVILKQIQYFDLTNNNGDTNDLIETLRGKVPEVFESIVANESSVKSENNTEEATTEEIKDRIDVAESPTVKKQAYIPKIKDIVTFGRYYQVKLKTDGAKQIEWIVLDVQGEKALLISKHAIENKPYNEGCKKEVERATGQKKEKVGFKVV